MNIRKAIGGALLSTTLTIGGTAMATAAPATTRPAPSADCIAAFRKLVGELQTADHMIHNAHDLMVLRAWAVKHHHPELVKIIDARLAKLKADGAKLRAEIEAQVAVVKADCKPAAA